MAKWKVSPERITLFPHPNADRLLVARVGMFPLVVGKGNGYEDGQIVVFAPKRSILPEWLRPHYVNEETGISYLKNGTTVCSLKLRGQLSEGCTIAPSILEERLAKNEETKQFPEFIGKSAEDLIGEDISPLLEIEEYIPPIPLNMAGEVESLRVDCSQHDVEGITIFADQFDADETVIITEKLHGSQGNLIKDGKDCYLSSKGFIDRGLVIKESDNNLYWHCVKNTNLIEILEKAFPGDFVQVMFEAIPCQKGFDYGQDKKTLRIFRLEVNKERISYQTLKDMTDYENNVDEILKLWVPVLHIGPFDMDVITKLAKGTEQVSGKNKHIKEGVVVEPATPRNASQGFPLYLKSINPKYKGEDDDDALS